MINDKYLKSVQFIESLLNNPGPNYLKANDKRDRSFFIKRLKFLLNLLDNPEKNFKYIHIAGTSGKSSLTAMLQSILTEANIKTGAYFSPHPTETFERIRIGHHYISPNNFAKLTDHLKPHLATCAVKSPFGIPSYFETLLALALIYFKQQKCEYTILEAGLGGTYDATNFIAKLEIAIITKIDFDHTEILGQTKSAIARDKAGIIKKNSVLITGERDPKILKIFQKICKEKNCQFRQVNFNYELLKNDLSGTKFKYQGEVYQTKLPGEHQIRNAILAIEAVRKQESKKTRKQESNPMAMPQNHKWPQNCNSTIKQCNNLTINYSTIKSGLAHAFLPCRLEIMQRRPTVILDGAHNPDKMKSTADFIKNLHHKGSLHLILALAEDKDLYNTIKHIVPLASKIYLTRFLIAGRKSQDLKKMSVVARKLTKNKIEIFIDPRDALNQVLQIASKNDIILVTGSFFLAGELRKRWIANNTTTSSN